MKNLVPLKRKKYYWDEIVSRKRPVTFRARLLAIRPLVIARFRVYSNHTAPNTLEVIGASPFGPRNTTRLKTCYKPSTRLSSLKKKIINSQNKILRAECQYCNISEPTTFDHYLPQRYFSEFSALSINLIPCCSKCNTEKGEEWLLPNGQRRIINLYYDTLPNVQYLNCMITFNAAVPRVIYTINHAVIPLPFRNTIVSHYGVLLLTERYREKSNSEITDVLNSIVPLVGILTRAQIQAHLIAEATSMQAIRGLNYWRAILKLALANSPTFLTNAGY